MQALELHRGWAAAHPSCKDFQWNAFLPCLLIFSLTLMSSCLFMSHNSVTKHIVLHDQTYVIILTSHYYNVSNEIVLCLPKLAHIGSTYKTTTVFCINHCLHGHLIRIYLLKCQLSRISNSTQFIWESLFTIQFSFFSKTFVWNPILDLANEMNVYLYFVQTFSQSMRNVVP